MDNGARAGSRPSLATGVWVCALLLAFCAGALLRGGGATPALAQNTPLAGARGIYAFTGQIDATRHGLFMIDIEQGTLWCYAIEPDGGVQKMRLIAARTWAFDRYLKDYQCAAPSFREVQDLVARERSMPPREDAASERDDRGNN